jgi:hypothetical protein
VHGKKKNLWANNIVGIGLLEFGFNLSELRTSLMLLLRREFQYQKLQDNSRQGVCHTVALPFTLKIILRQKKNYGNSNISPCKNIIFKKILEKKPNPSRYHNSITNLKFQHKPKYIFSKILI